jgi:hypothetical protein
VRFQDEIAQQQDADKRRERLLILVLVVAVIAVFASVWSLRRESRERREQAEATKTVVFLKHSLQLPPLWQKYAAGSTEETLVLNRGSAGPSQPMITLDDEREKPEIPAQFVDGWKNATRYPGFNPQSVDSFHDAAVDAEGATCVQVDWGGAQRAIKVICLSSDGRFKVSLSGSVQDTRALDVMVEQFGILEG